MKRWASVSFATMCLAACALVAGCARQPQPLEQPAPANEPDVAAGSLSETVDTSPTSSSPLEIREIRVVDDNGQQGVFVKLTRPPVDSAYYTLDNPSRLIIDLTGPTSGKTDAGRFAVEDNPTIRTMRIAEADGKLRLTIEMRGNRVPSYTVDSLDDALVAFIGESTGKSGRVKEQIVFRGGRPVTAVASTPPGSGGQLDRTLDRNNNNQIVPRRIYSGQKVSLDFKDADVHNVLRLLAEVSKLNIVATDDVRGKVTLKLFEVPWDQALDIVLQAMNLEMVQEGNVLRISTVARLRAEREELQRANEALKMVEPLRVEYIRVNYAKAGKLADIIGGAQANVRQNGAGGQRGNTQYDGVLTDRGTVLTDDFTNTLIVRDIQRGIDNARELVRRLDVQTPQVLIESNIVEATTDFARDLGVQWAYQGDFGAASGNPTGVNFPSSVGVGGAIAGIGGVPFLVDFPASNIAPGSASGIGLTFGSADGSQTLAARITALESQGKGKVISRPRVVTLNNVPATIKSLTIIRVKLPSTGTVINTGAGGSAGTQQVATEKIETGIILVVTPLVSSDGFVLLDLYAKSSQADFTRRVDDIPTEIAREANSHILVKDGQTVVLGGIYRDTNVQTTSGVPYFKDIPGLGWLFRNNSNSDRREDLLVFLTPRILGTPSSGMPSAAELWRNRSNS